ncbi:hypothetical protein H2248_003030 [Termitomyces sp. 'cryptogamus']|nr:hypothetical protein H2248_003030 [Termitomyces sp. 'cryptogamus']
MSTNQSIVVPLRGVLLGSLLMTCAWGIIAGSVGLNALIKSNQAKSDFKKLVPAGTTVDIDDHDAFASGVVLTTISALIAVLCFLFISMQICSQRLALRSLRMQSFLLAFCSAWLLATLVPFTDFFANRSAKVTAFIAGQQLPASIVKQAENAFGMTSVYRHLSYLRLVAILPWITLLFAIVTSAVLFNAGSRKGRGPLADPVENSPNTTDEKDEKDEKEPTA